MDRGTVIPVPGSPGDGGFAESGSSLEEGSKWAEKHGRVTALPVGRGTAIPVPVLSSDGELEAPDIPEHETWQPQADLSHLNPEERVQIERLLRDECHLFAREDTDIGEIPELQMEINLSDEIPVNEAYRHLPRKLYDDVKTYLQDLIVNGWIRESTSPYASPIVCVRKKDGSIQLCVDYWKLNAKTIPDRHPIPRMQDLLDSLHGQKLFTTLDMAKAYHRASTRKLAENTPPSLRLGPCMNS